MTFYEAGLFRMQRTIGYDSAAARRMKFVLLSVFRPLAGTMLAQHPKPHPDELEHLYLNAQAACEERGLALGPSCSGCQNNTATFALEPVLAP